MQTALQFRSSELSLRRQSAMDNVITTITKENKVANKSCKACSLLLLSFTKVICLFLKWFLREPEHINIRSLLQLWRWKHDSSTEPAGWVSNLLSINYGTLLRTRSQSVARGSRLQVAGPHIICIWHEPAGPWDRRVCGVATNAWMQHSRKPEKTTWASH